LFGLFFFDSSSALLLLFVCNTSLTNLLIHSPGRILTLLRYHIVVGSAARSLDRSLIIIMDDPPPTAKRRKTTTFTAAQDEAEKEPASILAEERKGATAKHDDRTVMNLLRSLPANIVADYIYPFAVKIIPNHEELIKAVDEYVDEYYRDEFFDWRGQRRISRPAGRNVDIHHIRYPIGDWDVSRVEDFTQCVRLPP
jgi:hypothetical protein